MKPKIAMLAHNMARGGAERFVSHLLLGLADDFDIHLLLFEDMIEYDLPQGQTVAFIDRGSKDRLNLVSIARLPQSAWRLRKYCESNEIELLISFLNRPNFTACLAKLAGLKIPLIISERIYTPSWFPEQDLRGKIAKRLVSWLYPMADLILPNSEGTRQALQDHYGVKTRYQVIRNIVDRTDIERQLKEPVIDVAFDRFTFVNVASFSPQKGHRSMVEAFGKLGTTGAQLLFVGKGVMFAEVRELVHSMGLENDILFLGHQDNPFKYLGKSHCFILASDFEGFPNVLTEAMACGLPVISTDCKTGPRELLAPANDRIAAQSVEQGQYGVLVPAGDCSALAEAMQLMFDDPGLRARYRKSGYERVKSFDVKPVTDHLRTILKEYLDSNGDR
jgi:N-acetylgalactosamine-N,N'-diacetylbacillosaminyl-diphospho-undecaprenol 4-alpha-N-acetylgalactosaminyltransferase